MRLVLFFILYSCSVVSGQTDLKQALIVSHADGSAEGQKVFKQRLYVYHFTNGTFTGREELLSFDGKSGGRDYVRTDRGKNQIHRQRYLITGMGNIIDLKEKKILFDGKAQLVKLRNDSAIFYTNDAFKGKFYSVYNFKTGLYGEVKDLLFKARFEQDIEFDKSQKPFRLSLYPSGKPPLELLSDAGYGQQHIKDYRHVPDPPVYWLSEKEFLYGHFNQAGSEVSLKRVNVSNGQSKTIGSVPIAVSSPEAHFEMAGQDLRFVCGSNIVYVDPLKNAVTAPEQCKPENGFSFALKRDQKGRSIFYKGKEIGHFEFDTDLFKAGQNLVATVKVLAVGEDSYQQGMYVWNDLSASWQKIEAEEVVALVGWINE